MSPRDKIAELLENPIACTMILAFILLNVLAIGLSAFGAQTGPVVTVCLMLFALELAARLYADGARFFRSGGNLFDSALLAASLALPWLGLLRLFRALPDLGRRLGLAEPARHAVALLTLLCTAPLAATLLYGATLPAEFGSPFAAGLTLVALLVPSAAPDGTAVAALTALPQLRLFLAALLLLAAAMVVQLLAALTAAALHRAASQSVTARLDRIEAMLKR